MTILNSTITWTWFNIYALKMIFLLVWVAVCNFTILNYFNKSLIPFLIHQNFKNLGYQFIDTFLRKENPKKIPHIKRKPFSMDELSNSNLKVERDFVNSTILSFTLSFFVFLGFLSFLNKNQKINEFYQIFPFHQPFYSSLYNFDNILLNLNQLNYISLKSTVLVFLTWILLAVGILGVVAFFTLLERKVLAALQHRKGPDIAGFFGILQPIADGAKLIKKQNITPASSNSLIFKISPILVFCLALTTWSVVSLDYEAQIVSLDFEILFILAISSLGVYGIILGGWSSNSKYAFLGALRSTGQMLSYEIALGLSILPVVLITGSFKLSEIISYQAIIFLPLLLMIFPSFIVFLISMLVETNRHPFDLPEAEAELVAGYNVEYGAFSFALFFLAEYASMILMSVLITLLFASGWDTMVALINCENSWAFNNSLIFFTSFLIACNEKIFNFFYTQVYSGIFINLPSYQLPTFYERLNSGISKIPATGDIFYEPSVTYQIFNQVISEEFQIKKFFNVNLFFEKNVKYSNVLNNVFDDGTRFNSMDLWNSNSNLKNLIYLVMNHEASILFLDKIKFSSQSINNYFDSSTYLTFLISDFNKFAFLWSILFFKFKIFLNKIMYYLTYIFLSMFFFFKVSLIYYFFVLVRGFLPRTRPDQLMSFGWKVLLPFAFGFLVYIIGILFYYDFAPIIHIFF